MLTTPALRPCYSIYPSVMETPLYSILGHTHGPLGQLTAGGRHGVARIHAMSEIGTVLRQWLYACAFWLPSAALGPAQRTSDGVPGREGDSLRNVRRGDWTPLELFLGGIRGLTLQLSIGDIEGTCGKRL